MKSVFHIPEIDGKWYLEICSTGLLNPPLKWRVAGGEIKYYHACLSFEQEDIRLNPMESASPGEMLEAGIRADSRYLFLVTEKKIAEGHWAFYNTVLFIPRTKLYCNITHVESRNNEGFIQCDSGTINGYAHFFRVKLLILCGDMNVPMKYLKG